jgi:hypothetical protein
MENLISNLVRRYELGSLTRRELIQSLAMLTAATGTASAAGFRASSIDHVSVAHSLMMSDAIDLPHPASSEGADDLVWPQFRSQGKAHSSSH